MILNSYQQGPNPYSYPLLSYIQSKLKTSTMLRHLSHITVAKESCVNI